MKMERTQKGTFAKGHKGFKPKGSKHGSTLLHQKLEAIIERELERLPEYINGIDKPEVKARLVVDLLPYKFPKKQATQSEITINDMSEAQIEELIEKLITDGQ